MDESIENMKGRVTDVLAALARYRSRYPENAGIESIMTQVERVQDFFDRGRQLSSREQQDLDFSLVEGTPLEHDEHLVRELYSIRNYAMHSL
jgi:hypothetical protein